MTFLLDRFSRPAAGFLPRTSRDLFALRLAQKLNDSKAVNHYASLAAEHSEAKLLHAYRRALHGSKNRDLGWTFQQELRRASEYQNGGRSPGLLAVWRSKRGATASPFFRDPVQINTHKQTTSVCPTQAAS